MDDAQAAPCEKHDPRNAYHRMLHADAHLDAWSLAADLVNHHSLAVSDTWPLAEPLSWLARTRPPAAAEWLMPAAEARRARVAALDARIRALPPAGDGLLLMQLAPWRAVEGCWLQFISNALNSHEPAAALLLRAYLRRVRLGADRFGTHCAAELSALGTVLPPASHAMFAHRTEIATVMFEAPAFALALSRHPTLLQPELLGFNLACALRGSEPLLEVLAPRHATLAALLAQTSTTKDGLIADDVADALAAIAAAAPDPARLRRGAQLADAALQRRDEALLALAGGGALSPAARMSELLRRKAEVAAGHHHRVRLGGQPLNALFTRAIEDPAPLLDALARSHHVRPGAPEASRLLTDLTAVRGVMAGIFDAGERAVIGAWIKSLGEGGAMADARLIEQPRVDDAAPAMAAPSASAPLGTPLLQVQAANYAEKGYANLPLRSLYWYLLHVESHPDVLPYARSLAALWLARAGAGLERGEQPLPFAQYDHAALDDWLRNKHAAQVRQADTPAGMTAPAAPTRAALIDSCAQLCPMVLIDGAWLQRSGQLASCGGEVGGRLYRIHLDEVGAGDVIENHPNLFRELMTAMDVDVPDFGTHAFSDWPLMTDASFRLPVFWLCISLFPRQFAAETLGLTLAVELSGVGDGYAASASALRANGFPSTFVDVHNTIDNVSSGHTALAIEAIKAYLDEALEQGGTDEVQRRWRRVWSGVRAIVPPTGIE